jgi:uncharacterized protein YtpQ (UPF0354 family)
MVHAFRIMALILGLATSAAADVPRPGDSLQTLGILADALQEAAPDLVLKVDEADVSLQIDLPNGASLRANPDNLHIKLQDAGTAAERGDILASHVAGVLATVSDQSASEAVPMDMRRVLPVLRTNDILTENPDFKLPHRTFPGGLIVYWVVDSPTQIASLTSDDIATTGLSTAAVGAQALQNLADRAADLEQRDLGGVTALVLDGNYEASFLLLPALWSEIDTRIGTVVVAPIARDLVIYGDGDDAEIVTAMRQIAREEFAISAYPISTDLFRWDADHWTVLP